MCQIMNKFKQLWDRHKIQKNSMVYQSNQILDKLNKEFKKVYILKTDMKYRVPTKKTFQNILENDVIDEIKYQSEYFDCENFAVLFKGISALHYRINSVGIVISYASAHAFNIILVEENNQLEIYKLEPQSDKLWKKEKPEREKYITDGEVILI